MAKSKTTTKKVSNKSEVTQEATEQVAAIKQEATEQETTEQDSPLVNIGKKLLATRPDKNVIYMTSDGFGFFEQCDAENYARNLDNKTVLSVKRTNNE